MKRQVLVLLGAVLVGGILLKAIGHRTDTAVSPPPKESPVKETAPSQKVISAECTVRKANGLLDPRECDLVELCKDRTFYEERVQKYLSAANLEAAVEAQKDLLRTVAWLAEYRTEDVTNICKGNYEPYRRAARVANGTGECSADPLEVFPVGTTWNNNRLLERIDDACPGAIFSPDSIRVTWRGKSFDVEVKKVSTESPAMYEITSLRGVY